MRITTIGFATLLGALLVSVGSVSGVTVIVPGSANPWLAGMPNGTTASGGDVAPDQSPVEVVGLPIVPGTPLAFSATGLTAYGPDKPLVGPEGSSFNQHVDGTENGIPNVTTRLSSLQGIFLDATQPDLTPVPAALDFSDTGNVPGGTDYVAISPLLKQVFFIGDGITEGGQQQRVVVPAGATRLFLGTQDGFGWANNIGSFEAQVTQVPEPSAFMLVALALLCWVTPKLHDRKFSFSS